MIPKSAVYILLAVSLLLFLPKLSMPLLDPDEGLYAEIAREMVTRGDWVIPHVNGLPYLEKPPLYFWLTASTFRLFGPSEWATRLWSAISALGTVLLTWRIGRRLYGAQAGLLAGVVVATVVGNALYVRRASTDQLFVFCLTLAMYGFLRDAERPDRGRARFLFVYAGAALGVLAKGFPSIPIACGLCWSDMSSSTFLGRRPIWPKAALIMAPEPADRNCFREIPFIRISVSPNAGKGRWIY